MDTRIADCDEQKANPVSRVAFRQRAGSARSIRGDSVNVSIRGLERVEYAICSIGR